MEEAIGSHLEEDGNASWGSDHPVLGDGHTSSGLLSLFNMLASLFCLLLSLCSFPPLLPFLRKFWFSSFSFTSNFLISPSTWLFQLFRITALLFIHLLMLPPSGAVVSPSNWFSSWSLSNSCCQLGSVSHWLLQICHFPNINLQLTQIWSFSNESGIMWMLWKSKGDVQSETLFSSRGFMCDIIIAIVQANCQSSCYMYSQRTVGFAIPGSVGWL